ncbi:hypothetical protein PQR33_22195 [Paraburkholderia sediminicola]|uniref:hypothetical protein n=1 Tax=Paraburkholderia sediminicola TaxID=458836 RepID=UPI0038B789C0
MIRDHTVQFLAATKYILAMVAMSVELTVTSAVWSDNPKVSVAADDNNVAVNHSCNVDVSWHRLVCLFHHHWTWRRRCQRARKDFVYLVWVNNQLALLVCCAPHQSNCAYGCREQRV